MRWGALAVYAALAAAQPVLEPVPPPGPGVVEESVRRELAEAHRAVTGSDPTLRDDPAALAAAYGELGRLYAAYELWDAARPAFANAVRLDPGSPRWHHYLGYVLERKGDLAGAARHFDEAAKSGSNRWAARLRRAEIDLALGRTEAAVQAFRRLSEEATAARGRGPGLSPAIEAAARFGLGRALAAAGDPEGAIPELRRALELQPEASQVHYALGQAYRRAGRVDEARRHLALRGEQPVRFPDPDVDSLASAARGGAFHKFRGDQAVQAGRLEEAAEAYRRAVAAEPESFYYRKSLGLTLYRLGRADEAARELEAALALEPDLPAAQVPVERARLHFALGGIAANRGASEAALRHFREAARLDPAYADAHLQIGNLLGAAGRLEEAAAAFGRAVAADPDAPAPRLQRATTLMDLGRFAEAVPELERYLELAPGDERARQLLAIARREAGER
jgi:tetratricopeptide (TPR) repeat protein